MKNICVSDLGQIVTGKTPRTSVRENYGGTTPFLTPTDLNGYKFIDKTASYLTEIGLAEVYNCLLPEGSICFTCIGNIGNVVKLQKPSVTNQQFNSVIVNSNYDSEYVYYMLRIIGTLLKEKIGNNSTVLPIISKSRFSEIRISVEVNKEIQNKLANILSLIDDKIILNTRMNAELEAMAKQLYDYWFVQFDFPDENGNPYKSSGGKMVYNPTLKREIPAGWELEYLGNLMYFSNGINYDKNIVGDKEYNIINVRNITSSTVFIVKDDLDRITLPQANAKKYMIDEEDIIIARSGTPGATRLIDSPKDTIYCGFIIKGSPKYPWMKYYLFNKLKQLEGTDATKTGGSILQNVSQDTLKGLPLVVPPKINVDMFNETIIRLFSRLNMNLEQSAQLTHLRDSLLPMLMNGQVTVE